MKFILLFVFIAISVFAHEKWISLKQSEKKDITEKSYKTDINLSHIQSVNSLLEGAKIIFPLMDKKTNAKKQNHDSQKKWFIIKKIDEYSF